MATAEAIATAIASLSGAYRVEIDKTAILTWGRALRDVDDDVLGEAIDSWVRNCGQFPRPAEIIQTAQIIVRRRRERTAALPEARPSPEEQLDINRRGVELVREELTQARLRVGTPLDEYLDDKES